MSEPTTLSLIEQRNAEVRRWSVNRPDAIPDHAVQHFDRDVPKLIATVLRLAEEKQEMRAQLLAAEVMEDERVKALAKAAAISELRARAERAEAATSSLGAALERVREACARRTDQGCTYIRINDVLGALDGTEEQRLADVAPQQDSFPSGDDHRSGQPATSQADHGPRPPAAAGSHATSAQRSERGEELPPGFDEGLMAEIREVAADLEAARRAVPSGTGEQPITEEKK